MTKYMKTMYQMKMESPKGSDKYLLAKLMLNSCYGKYGQKLRENSMPGANQVSWYCLSWSRWQLREFKNICKQVDCKYLFYGDTDSIFVDKETYDKIKSNYPKNQTKALGDRNLCTFECEGECPSITVLGKKMYHCETKVGTKGIHKCSVTRDDFIQVLKGEIVEKSWEGPEKHKTGDTVEIFDWKEYTRKMNVNVPTCAILCLTCGLYTNKTVNM